MGKIWVSGVSITYVAVFLTLMIQGHFGISQCTYNFQKNCHS